MEKMHLHMRPLIPKLPNICKRNRSKRRKREQRQDQSSCRCIKSDEIKDFINEKYDGAVIPFEDSDDAEAEDTEAADADESADAEADTADEAAEETDAE